MPNWALVEGRAATYCEQVGKLKLHENYCSLRALVEERGVQWRIVPQTMSEPTANANESSPSAGGSVSASSSSTEQRFTWNFDHKLDGQKRVQFPANWRPQDPETRYTLVLWPHPHLQPEREFAYILGLTKKQFDAMLDKMERQSLGNRQVGALRRKIFHNSFELPIDPAGRLCLPPKMAAQIGLDKEAHFVGAGSHFEIWDPTTFEKCTKADDALAAEAYENLI